MAPMAMFTKQPHDDHGHGGRKNRWPWLPNSKWGVSLLELNPTGFLWLSPLNPHSTTIH